MQSDTPQGDPRLQRTNPGTKVATGYVDPCIVYLEATQANEVPVLFACWARSSSETRYADASYDFKLDEVVILKGKPLRSFQGWTMKDGQTRWHFGLCQSKKLIFKRTASGWTLKGFPSFSQSDSAYGFQGSLKFIDAETDAALHKLKTNSSPGSSALYSEKILRLAPVEWPSLVNALASFNCKTVKQRRKPIPSLFRRLMTSVFKKKQKPVAA